jgi:hypothetical protein
MATSNAQNTAENIFLNGTNNTSKIVVLCDQSLTTYSNDVNNIDYNSLNKVYKYIDKNNLYENKITHKLNDVTINKLNDKISKEKITNLILLKNSFLREMQIYNSKSEVISNNILSSFESISKKLYLLPFKECAVEIPNSGSIKFSLVFDNEKLLMLKTINEDDETVFSKNKVIYTYFIKKNYISSDIADIDDFIEKFHHYLTF